MACLQPVTEELSHSGGWKNHLRADESNKAAAADGKEEGIKPGALLINKSTCRGSSLSGCLIPPLCVRVCVRACFPGILSSSRHLFPPLGAGGGFTQWRGQMVGVGFCQ